MTGRHFPTSTEAEVQEGDPTGCSSHRIWLMLTAMTSWSHCSWINRFLVLSTILGTSFPWLTISPTMGRRQLHTLVRVTIRGWDSTLVW